MSESKVRMRIRKRIYLVLTVCITILVFLIGKTGYLQIVKGDQLQKQAIEQQTRDRIINSKKGCDT